MTAAPGLTRVFTARYRNGVLLAPAPGCLLAPIFILPGMALTKSLAIAIAVAAAAFLLTAWIWTLRRRARPALVLSEAGLEIDGLPLIPWGQVLAIRRAIPGQEGGLIVRLRRKLFGEAGAIRAPALLTPLWRPVDETAILLRAAILEDPPGDVESAFRYFLGR